MKRLSYTIAEFCAITGLGRTSIFNDIRTGKLKAKKHGKRKTLILAEVGEAYLKDLEDAGGGEDEPPTEKD